MNVKRLIFSDSPKYVWSRHLLFWLVYCMYFYIQSINPQSLEEFKDPRTYSNAFISLYSFVPVCIISVYVSISFILPLIVKGRRYFSAMVSMILLFSAGATVNYFAAKMYYSHSGVVPYIGKGALSLGYLNTIWAMIISGVAMGIYITKNWYLQQKEISEIARQKTRNELHLQKKRMHPEFLYSSLDSIHLSLNNERTTSSSMILVLSNLLSYSLYETESDKVPLRNELSAVEDFIALEEMKRSNEIILHVDANIDTEELLVTPMILLSVLQNGINKLNSNGILKYTINIDMMDAGEEMITDVKFSGITAKENFTDPSVTLYIPKIYGEAYEPA